MHMPVHKPVRANARRAPTDAALWGAGERRSGHGVVDTGDCGAFSRRPVQRSPRVHFTDVACVALGLALSDAAGGVPKLSGRL